MGSLFEEERIARTEGSIHELEKIHDRIIDVCTSEDDVIHVLKLLNNKRKQETSCMKRLIKKMLDKKYSNGFYEGLLSQVLEGKTYLEEERIYIAEYLKQSYGNNIKAAYNVMKDIPVETFTSVSEATRNGFLFEQLRLSLLLGLLNEAELIVRKAKLGYMTNEEKSVFLNYRIILSQGKKSYLEASRIYFDLSKITNSKAAVTLGSFFCLISNSLTEGINVKNDKENILKEYERNEMNDTEMRKLIRRFSKDEIIEFDFANVVLSVVERYKDMMSMIMEDNGLESKYIFDFKRSILEHNFFVAQKFFSTAKIEHLFNILNVDEEAMICFICEMVNEKFADVKINQQDRVINFGNKQWDDSVDEVLDKLVLASHLIHQESIQANFK